MGKSPEEKAERSHDDRGSWRSHKRICKSSCTSNSHLECPFFKDVRAKFNCMSFDRTLWNLKQILARTDEFLYLEMFALRSDYAELQKVFMFW